MEGVGAIAEIPPIELLILERAEKYMGEQKVTARENLIRKWQKNWDNGSYGRWTYALIPDIRTWMDRPYGEVDYFLTQVLSGHGCFRKYLFKRQRADSEKCVHCGEIDDVEHTMFLCLRWLEIRNEYRAETGQPINAINMMEYRAIRGIIEQKEKESR